MTSRVKIFIIFSLFKISKLYVEGTPAKRGEVKSKNRPLVRNKVLTGVDEYAMLNKINWRSSYENYDSHHGSKNKELDRLDT